MTLFLLSLLLSWHLHQSNFIFMTQSKGTETTKCSLAFNQKPKKQWMQSNVQCTHHEIWNKYGVEWSVEGIKWTHFVCKCLFSSFGTISQIHRITQWLFFLNQVEGKNRMSLPPMSNANKRFYKEIKLWSSVVTSVS